MHCRRIEAGARESGQIGLQTRVRITLGQGTAAPLRLGAQPSIAATADTHRRGQPPVGAIEVDPAAGEPPELTGRKIQCCRLHTADRTAS